MGNQMMVLIGAACIASVTGLFLFRIGPIEKMEEQGKKLSSLAFIPILLVSLFLALFLPWMYDMEFYDIVLTLFFISMMWSCAWYDFYLHIIPNRVLIGALVIRAVLFAVQLLIQTSQIRYILLSSGMAALGLVIAAGLCRLVIPKSVGMGDIKLLAVMGLYLGMLNTWSAIFFSLLILFFLSVFLLVTKRAERNSELPFAPFVLFGTIFAAVLTGI